MIVSRRPVVLSLAAFGVTGLALLILISMLTGLNGDPLLIDRAAQPRSAAAAPCGDLTARTEKVSDLLTRGQLTAALAEANDGLTRPTAPDCAEAHLALARLWYAADLDDLLATQVDDEALGRQAPMRWVSIERRADQLGVPTEERRPKMTLAETAYDRGLWQLADAAFRDAWAVGQIGVGGVEFRHALLRNWGHRLTLRNSAVAKTQGLGLLATAHAIARRYDLQTDVACTDLRALGVADCSRTVPDPDEPTLAGPRRAGAP
ncbi:MAG: hypothetical protein EPO26_06140 [Chloroflexota bacterium]|nr:MAG: hypothetical protein EPO26_06140 [Chloroflexota bacterium]